MGIRVRLYPSTMYVPDDPSLLVSEAGVIIENPSDKEVEVFVKIVLPEAVEAEVWRTGAAPTESWRVTDAFAEKIPVPPRGRVEYLVYPAYRGRLASALGEIAVEVKDLDAGEKFERRIKALMYRSGAGGGI